MRELNPSQVISQSLYKRSAFSFFASNVDPTAEIARIRHSLSLLETHIVLRGASSPPTQEPSSSNMLVGPIPPPPTPIDPSIRESIPGIYGRHGHRGYYAGPTSAASQLLMEGPRSRTPSEEAPGDQTLDGTRDYDRDLIAVLPPFHILDALLEYYFEYCNWVYRHVNQAAFLSAWQKFKTGHSSSRLTLATATVLSALVIRYLPPGHELLSSLPTAIPSESSYDELSTQYYNTMKTALQRYKDENNPYTLEFVELQLVRCHYLTFTKTSPEETWSVRGELVTVGTAMGLHRDPGRSRYSRDMAERRRWAWWHIILLERWQAFMFGRPLAIASHHFNTQLPSYCSPELDKAGRLYYPNVALFRLAFILGEIMDNAVSLRPVTYESFKRNDQLLVEWLETLPPEIDLDYPDLSQALLSPITSRRRIAVQSIITRTAFYHIRFTLHRPYAIGLDSEKTKESRKIAIDSAEKLLALAKQTSPGYLDGNTQISQAIHPSIRGHLNWRPFHVFSAGMFFTFQLIRDPDIPEGHKFRQHLRTVFYLLENSGSMPVAEKSLQVLHTLAPLYSEEFYAMDERLQAEHKASILSVVRNLDFPYQSPPAGNRPSESPANNMIFSFSGSDRSGQSTSGDQMKVESLLGPGRGNPNGSDQKYSHTPPNQSSSQPPAMLPPSSSIIVPPPAIPNNLLPVSGTYTQPYPQFDHNVAGPSTQADVNIPYYMQQYEYLYGGLPASRQQTMGWTPAVDTWGGGTGFPQNEWYSLFDGSGAPTS
ncbi:hypothetical protein BDM02DRAFT_3094934 [Thelephora ganbajun]|uniref:Uncharacterized protein n=1 Tax=Thelephora ganbajun TaxID=370292 RepID=A0ACB6ZJI5_THEGA|nr:hypothetical protein BDM02DRAFT_3094934 [Thelephora ganbajun]